MDHACRCAAGVRSLGRLGIRVWEDGWGDLPWCNHTIWVGAFPKRQFHLHLPLNLE